MDSWSRCLSPTNRSIWEMATRAAQVFKDHVATRVVECWGNDVPGGKLLDV